MLVLTREIGETILIGDDTSITIEDIKGMQAVLGAEAPKEIPVHREEIYARIHSEEAQYINRKSESPSDTKVKTPVIRFKKRLSRLLAKGQ